MVGCGMKRIIIAIAILGPMVTALAITALTLLDRTFAHISIIYPEYATLDSVYIDARGVPNPMWMKNDPSISGYGEPKEAVIWTGIEGNWMIWSIVLYIIESPALLIVAIFFIVKKKRQESANKGLDHDFSGVYFGGRAE